ncbi:fluoride efflux transporter CrcB [Flavobacterium sp.]|uniref:fluoride efflux transporter CrcB n=1 Tax=Flavobacterium sp. TaxID=239 RepID=UPI003342C3BB
MIKNIFLVLLGGGIGSVVRYLLSYFLTKNSTTQFPWATFIANALGCLLIGLLFGYIQKNNVQNETLKLLLITGFCGGFTTFSTFSLENIQFIQNQNYNLALLYTISSIFIGFFGVLIGLKLFN